MYMSSCNLLVTKLNTSKYVFKMNFLSNQLIMQLIKKAKQNLTHKEERKQIKLSFMAIDSPPKKSTVRAHGVAVVEATE